MKTSYFENLKFQIKKDEGTPHETVIMIDGSKLKAEEKKKLAACLKAQQNKENWGELVVREEDMLMK